MTVSYAQTGKVCYDSEELKLIATKVVKANELDTLLKVSDVRIADKDSVIAAQKLVIANDSIGAAAQDSVIVKLKGIGDVWEQENIDLKLVVKKKSNQLRLAQTGIGAVLLAWLLSIL